MGLDYSELDAQLTALGAVRSDILQIARRHAGDMGSLSEIDQMLSSLGSGVPLTASPGRSAPKKRPAPQLVSAPAQPAAQTKVTAPSPDETASPVEPEAAAASPAPERSGPPHSEEIALPDPVQEHDRSPRSGELSLDGPTPRSGSFALDPTPSEPSLDEAADADFEAEFAALSGADTTATKSLNPKSLRPTEPPESEPPEAQAPEPVQLVSDEDEETDAVLALFDAIESTPEAEAVALEPTPFETPASLSSLGGLSDELEPSIAPPPTGSRDPDAEFDALFDEASSPSSVPSSPAPDGDQDSVDDLLRDLGSPRMPQDLAAKATREDPLSFDDELDDPTEIFDSSAFDAVAGALDKAAPSAPDLEEDLEIEMDIDEVIEDEPPPITSKPPVTPPRPPPRTSSAPAGAEKRPSFLGRLFGGANKDDK